METCNHLILMYITNRLDVALIAQKYGVERIWVDLETIGKEDRQKHQNSVKSHHKVSDIANIAPHLTTSQMMVRINHWNSHSTDEIEAVIAAGAQIIMLPYWKTVDEVKNFLSAVNGRCKTSLLLETKEAEHCLDKVLELPGIDEIHIGLNDLHLSYGLDFMFEVLTNGTVEHICKKIAAKGIPYGFGGIAQIRQGAVPAEKIMVEHYRLGSTRVILSRSFCNYEKIENLDEIDSIFAQNIKKLRTFEESISRLSTQEVENNKRELAVAVAQVAATLRAKKQAVSC